MRLLSKATGRDLILVVLMIVGIVVLSVMTNKETKAQEESRTMIASLESELDDLRSQKFFLENEPTPEEYKEVLVEATLSATEVGAKLIELDEKLSAFYKAGTDFPTEPDEIAALLKEKEVSEKEWTELTGAEAGTYHMTWQLNPAWSIQLETVLNYTKDTKRLPVLFTMKTEAGEMAGVVYGIYDVEAKQVQNIVRHYTSIGLADEVDAAVGR